MLKMYVHTLLSVIIKNNVTIYYSAKSIEYTDSYLVRGSQIGYDIKWTMRYASYGFWV